MVQVIEILPDQKLKTSLSFIDNTKADVGLVTQGVSVSAAMVLTKVLAEYSSLSIRRRDDDLH